MKIKHKTIDKVKVKLTHKELVLINEALKSYRVNPDCGNLNDKLFDRDEYKEKTLIQDVYTDIKTLQKEIQNSLNEIVVW